MLPPSPAAGINACDLDNAPCNQRGSVNATCTDFAPPFIGDREGRNCSCPAGYIYSEDQGCQGESELNCSTTGALKVQLAAEMLCLMEPELGTAASAFSTLPSHLVPFFADIPACVGNPCQGIANADGVCSDEKPPLSWFTCGCSFGFGWSTLDRQCPEGVLFGERTWTLTSSDLFNTN